MLAQLTRASGTMESITRQSKLALPKMAQTGALNAIWQRQSVMGKLKPKTVNRLFVAACVRMLDPLQACAGDRGGGVPARASALGLGDQRPGGKASALIGSLADACSQRATEYIFNRACCSR